MRAHHLPKPQRYAKFKRSKYIKINLIKYYIVILVRESDCFMKVVNLAVRTSTVCCKLKYKHCTLFFVKKVQKLLSFVPVHGENVLVIISINMWDRTQYNVVN